MDAQAPGGVDIGDGDLLARVARLGERGASTVDPVGFRLVESMAMRAQAHRGRARHLIDRRLLALIGALDERVRMARGAGDEATGTPGAASSASAPTTPTPTPTSTSSSTPLQLLLDHVARQSAAVPLAGSTTPDAIVPLPAGELKALTYFRSTWLRLRTEGRLRQSLAALPENAGPLNSQQLVHRALHLMREQSPGYLQHFMAYLDTLLWLDQWTASTSAPAPEPPRADKPKKGSRRKAG